MDEIEEEINVNCGFDRGVDYEEMMNNFKKRINKVYDKYMDKKADINIKRLVYLVVASIQLANGSRISEAVKAFILFLKYGIKSRVTVKVSKSGALKVMKNGEKKRTKVKGREMQWPPWVESNIYQLLKDHKEGLIKKIIDAGTLKKRTLDYLLINFNSNTHSLRYAFINHALYVWKRPINDVAKFVGHANTAQMVTYTQAKNANQLFDLVKNEKE